MFDNPNHGLFFLVFCCGLGVGCGVQSFMQTTPHKYANEGDGPAVSQSRTISSDDWKRWHIKLMPSETVILCSRCEKCWHLQRFTVECESMELEDEQ
jgi:hypothetical protein